MNVGPKDGFQELSTLRIKSPDNVNENVCVSMLSALKSPTFPVIPRVSDLGGGHRQRAG